MKLIPQTRYTRSLVVWINLTGWGAAVLDDTANMAGLNATVYGQWKRFQNGTRVMLFCWNAGVYTHWRA